MVEQLHAARATEIERLSGQVLQGRQLAHAIKNDLSVVVGTLEMLRSWGGLTTDQQRQADEALARLESVAMLIDQLHALVKNLEPT